MMLTGALNQKSDDDDDDDDDDADDDEDDDDDDNVDDYYYDNDDDNDDDVALPLPGYVSLTLHGKCGKWLYKGHRRIPRGEAGGLNPPEKEEKHRVS